MGGRVVLDRTDFHPSWQVEIVKLMNRLPNKSRRGLDRATRLTIRYLTRRSTMRAALVSVHLLGDPQLVLEFLHEHVPGFWGALQT
jgi:hypothetical protein